ncbi:hypothetical protein ACS0TY_001739 [Phlomoides rotata]
MGTRAFSFIFLLSLLLLAYVSDARKDPGTEYWKSVMDEESMPKAITDLLHQNPTDTKTERFVRNFETKPNVIIYHSNHVHSVEG